MLSRRPAGHHVLAATVTLLTMIAAGGEVSAEEPPSVPGTTDLLDEITRHDDDLERRIVGLWGARASRALALSARVGLMVARQPASFDCTTTCEYRGPLVQLEPGIGGGQLSFGHGKVIGEHRGNRHFLAHVFLAYAVKGVILHSWSDASSVEPGETYLGVEGDLTAVMVNFSLGIFRHVSGDDDDWIVTAGLGWGF